LTFDKVVLFLWIFFQKPGRKIRDGWGWTIQAKLELYLWLGDYVPGKRDKPYLAGLPSGFTEQYMNEGNNSEPPIAITYERK